MNILPISQKSFKALYIDENLHYTQDQYNVINKISNVLNKQIESDDNLTYKKYFENKNIGFYATPSVNFDSVDLSYINDKEPKSDANSLKKLKKVGTYSYQKPFKEINIKDLYISSENKDFLTSPKSLLAIAIGITMTILAALSVIKYNKPNAQKNFAEKTTSSILNTFSKSLNNNHTLQIK